MERRQKEQIYEVERDQQFFLILLAHNNLKNYYKLIFNMAQHHGYSITDLENLIPYELEIYSSMLIDHLERKKQEQEAARR